MRDQDAIDRGMAAVRQLARSSRAYAELMADPEDATMSDTTTDHAAAIDNLAKRAWHEAMREDAGLADTLQEIRASGAALAADLARVVAYARALEYEYELRAEDGIGEWREQYGVAALMREGAE